MENKKRFQMCKLIAFTLFLNLTCSVFAQTKNTTYKNKSGNPVGHSKQQSGTTTYYNKSGNKTGSAKTSSNGTTTFYNKQGNKTGTNKTK